MNPNNKHYISADLQSAIAADGTLLEVGDAVNHESEGDSAATILAFALDFYDQQIKAVTTLGMANIDYLSKVKN